MKHLFRTNNLFHILLAVALVAIALAVIREMRREVTQIGPVRVVTEKRLFR